MSAPAAGPSRGLHPVREVREFIRAALVTPVARDHTESDANTARPPPPANDDDIAAARLPRWAVTIASKVCLPHL